VVGNYAYVSNVESGIRIISVSDSVYPWQVSLYRGEPGSLAIADNYLCVAARSGGLRAAMATATVAKAERVSDSLRMFCSGCAPGQGGHVALTGRTTA